MTFEEEDRSFSGVDDENNSMLHLNPKRHNIKTSIQHWQLRDMVSFPYPDDNELVAVVHQSNVIQYNLQTREREFILQNLSFSPTAMTTGCGYLAVAGQRSQVVVKNMNGMGEESVVQTTVGGAINNALHISEHLGGKRLMVCNNDETIKIFTLPHLEHLGDIKMDSAVNSGNNLI